MGITEINSNPSEKIHHICFDNGIYKALVRKGNEEKYNQFYDSLISYIPSINNGLYKTYFSAFSLLEAIGLGSFQEKRNPDIIKYEDILNLPVDINYEKWIKDKYEKGCDYYLKLPELDSKELLKKIDEDLIYSSNQALKPLINDTLIRYKEAIINDPVGFSKGIAHLLSWDLLCSTINFENISLNIYPTIAKKLEHIDDVLLKIFYGNRLNKIDLDSHRLFSRIAKREMISKKFANYKELNNFFKKFAIKNKKDLCDSEIIHYATLGILDEQALPAIIFTYDSKHDILERLKVQISVIRLINEIKNYELTHCNGLIYLVDQKTYKISDAIYIASLS